MSIKSTSEAQPTKALHNNLPYGTLVKFNGTICLVCYGFAENSTTLVSLADPEVTWTSRLGYEVEVLPKGFEVTLIQD